MKQSKVELFGTPLLWAAGLGAIISNPALSDVLAAMAACHAARYGSGRRRTSLPPPDHSLIFG